MNPLAEQVMAECIEACALDEVRGPGVRTYRHLGADSSAPIADQHMEFVRGVLQRRHAWLQSAFHDNGLATLGCRMSVAQGGYFVWLELPPHGARRAIRAGRHTLAIGASPDCPRAVDARHLLHSVRERAGPLPSLSFHPGARFGEGLANGMRLSFSQNDEEAARQVRGGRRALGSAIARSTRDGTQGMARLAAALKTLQPPRSVATEGQVQDA